MRLLSIIAWTLFLPVCLAEWPATFMGNVTKGKRLDMTVRLGNCGIDKTISLRELATDHGWRMDPPRQYVDIDGVYGTKGSKWIEFYAEHDPQTYYLSLFNYAEGIILASDSKHTTPNTAHWSQVVFTAWAYFAPGHGVQAASVRKIRRFRVGNPIVKAIMRQIMAVEGELPIIEGHDTVHAPMLALPDTDPYYALLNTPNGMGCAHMLAEHPELRGLVFQDIEVLRIDDEFYQMDFNLQR